MRRKQHPTHGLKILCCGKEYTLPWGRGEGGLLIKEENSTQKGSSNG